MADSVIKHLARRVVNIGVCHKIPKEADAAVENAITEELLPLLCAAQAVIDAHDPRHPGSVEGRLKEELMKWRK